MKVKAATKVAVGLCLLSLVAALTAVAQEAAAPAAPAAPAGPVNPIKDGSVENYSVGPVPQEQFGKWWAPVSKEVGENTFFNVTTEKAHEGKKSIKIALTPETSQKWLAAPGKPGFDALWFHHSFKQGDKKAIAACSGAKVVFKCWAFVEKGSFSAKVKVRASSPDDNEPVIDGVLEPSETGKWTECKLEGEGRAGLTRVSDVRMEIDCPGDFVVYLDDFYLGPE
jgi:hypothetical protein